MTTRRGRLISTCVWLALLVPAATLAQVTEPPAQSGGAASEPQLRDRIGRALTATGLTVDSADKSWKLTFKGDQASSIPIDVSLYNDIVLVQSGTISTGTLSAAQFTWILEQNFQKDLVKVGILNGKLIVSSEAEARTIDGPLLKRMIEAVAVFADETYGELVAGTAPAGEAEAPALNGPPRGRPLQRLDLNRGAAILEFERNIWRRVGRAEEGQYQYRDEEVYFRVIAERTELTFESLENVVLANVRKMDQQAQTVRKTFRDVNGVRVLVMETHATLSGVPLVYYGHYYTGKAGTIQIVAWTTRSQLDDYRSIFDDVVSGLQIK